MEVIFDHKDIKKSIIKSQHVQRCWDLSREIPEEDIELLVHAATNCPSKQNFKFYKLHVITNRDKIEKIHSMTEGLRNIEGEMSTNSQTLANLLLVFESVSPTQQFKDKWALRDNSKDYIYKYDGKEYVKLKTVKKREVDQYGKTHYVEVDTWKPEKKKQTEEDDLPF